MSGDEDALRNQVALLKVELEQKSERLVKVQRESQTVQRQYQELLSRVLELQSSNEALLSANAEQEVRAQKQLTELARLRAEISD
jgi:chromosome segregation ATPase